MRQDVTPSVRRWRTVDTMRLVIGTKCHVLVTLEPTLALAIVTFRLLTGTRHRATIAHDATQTYDARAPSEHISASPAT